MVLTIGHSPSHSLRCASPLCEEAKCGLPMVGAIHESPENWGFGERIATPVCALVRNDGLFDSLFVVVSSVVWQNGNVNPSCGVAFR